MCLLWGNWKNNPLLPLLFLLVLLAELDLHKLLKVLLKANTIVNNFWPGIQ